MVSFIAAFLPIDVAASLLCNGRASGSVHRANRSAHRLRNIEPEDA